MTNDTINNGAKCEVRAVTRFLMLKNNYAVEIHRQIYELSIISDAKVAPFISRRERIFMMENVAPIGDLIEKVRQFCKNCRVTLSYNYIGLRGRGLNELKSNYWVIQIIGDEIF